MQQQIDAVQTHRRDQDRRDRNQQQRVAVALQCELQQRSFVAAVEPLDPRPSRRHADPWLPDDGMRGQDRTARARLARTPERRIGPAPLLGGSWTLARGTLGMGAGATWQRRAELGGVPTNLEATTLLGL